MSSHSFPLQLYVVREDDTLESIIEKNHMSLDDLYLFNPTLKRKTLHFGMPLNVFCNQHTREIEKIDQTNANFPAIRDLFVYFAFFPNYFDTLLASYMNSISIYLQNHGIYEDFILEKIHLITTNICLIVNAMQNVDSLSIQKEKEKMMTQTNELIKMIQEKRKDYSPDCLLAIKKIPSLLLSFLLYLWNDNKELCKKKEEEILQELAYFRR